MKIISHFKDYYDHQAFIYGVDETRVWKRITSKEDIIDSEKQSFFSYSPTRKNFLKKEIEFDFFDVWFCDKNYPFIQSKIGRGIDAVYQTYFTYDQLVSKWSDDKFMTSYFLEKAESHLNRKSERKLNTKFNSPQLLHGEVDSITLNINLKNHGFSHIVSAEQAFQRISMWLGARPDVPQTVPTDLDRFEAKGFDRKTSFRKM